jgi:hypothetical protein
VAQLTSRTVHGSWCALATAMVMLTCLSCTRLERVSLPEIDAQQLVGKQIRVTTTDGRILEFELTAVADDALVGRWERVRFDEIAVVERRDISVWRTVGTAGAVAGTVVGVVAMAMGVAFLVFLVQWMGALNGS